MNIINVVCGSAGSAELAFTTFSFHNIFFFFFFLILENLDLENPRNIESNWYGLRLYSCTNVVLVNRN